MSPCMLDLAAQTVSPAMGFEVTQMDRALMDAMPMPVVAALKLCAKVEKVLLQPGFWWHRASCM